MTLGSLFDGIGRSTPQMDNSDKSILDLCGGTGAWSRPYKEAGYDVRLITLPDYDVTNVEFCADYMVFNSNKTTDNPYVYDIAVYYKDVYGILAAPPCTDFSVSGSQYWKQKDLDGRTITSMSIVMRCLTIIAYCNPIFWAMENPVGRLRRWVGDPALIFDPCDYGDAYTKKTLLWGRFNTPEKAPVKPMSNDKQQNPISQPTINGKKIRWNTPEAKMLRSITPPGFAQAFYRANK